MKKILVFTLIYFLTSSFSYSQKRKVSFFDINDFNKKTSLVEWLYEYDAIAWWTSDSIMVQDTSDIKRLGDEWFCYQESNKFWHAVYGKYLDGNYDLVFHFIIDTNYNVRRSYLEIDSSILNAYSRALILANKKLEPVRDSLQIQFNQYIRKNEDNSFTVWFFPAMRSDGVAIFCGEYIFNINPTGKIIISDESNYKRECLGFKLDKPREVWIEETSLESPSLTSVFFVWFYKKYFTYIKIDNKEYVTTVIKSDNNSYSWMSYEKEMENKKKSKKKK